MKTSELANMLRVLLRETDVLTSPEWAEVLAVSESTIQRWLTDKLLPRPEALRRILRTLEETPTVPNSFLEQFEAMANKPLFSITPHSNVPETTLAQYMVRPVREGFYRLIDTLPVHQQEAFLLEAGELARTYRNRPAPHLTVAERRATSLHIV